MVFVDHGMFALWRDRCFVGVVDTSGEISYDVGGSSKFISNTADSLTNTW